MSEISGKKFINLFSTLTKTEARDFRTYLKRQVGPGVAVDLLSYLLKFHPSFSHEGRLTLEALHHQLYRGEQAFSSKRILNLFSDLHRALRPQIDRQPRD